MKKLIGYIRVSTEEQGKTKAMNNPDISREEVLRLGMDAQRAAILRFGHDNGYHIVDIVEEVASGKLDLEDRPVLAAAMAKAMKAKDTYIVVNKLDRLSRSSAFINNLMDHAKVKFIVTELGEEVNNFMLRIYAAVAQQEREMISQRTKDALTALKAKGKVLGATQAVVRKANAVSIKVQSEKADAFAERLKPTVQRMVGTGMTLRQMAEELNANGTRTARGGDWHPATVKNLIARF